MSKLIVCTGTLAAGGAERVLSILSKPFADAFDDVQYVLWLDDKFPDIFYEIDPRVKIVRISKESRSQNTWRQMLWFRRYVKREKPDIVLSFMIVLCLTVTIALIFSGIKQAVALRNDPYCMKRKWLRRLATWSFYSKDVKVIFAQTQSIRNFYEEKPQLYRKTKVIFNPILLDESLVGAAIDHDKFDIVVCVGRLTHQKQPLVMIKAFDVFLKTHSTYKLVFYGEGELRKQMLEYADSLGINEKIVLAGQTKDVVNAILSAQMFVMTSRNEGMSNALIEAMCIGLPCISTKVSGAVDLIEDGENGVLVEIGDTNTIAERMSMLADNPQMRDSIGKKASSLYKKLSSSVISKQWVDCLLTVAKG